jgi:hypothetical protein
LLYEPGAASGTNSVPVKVGFACNCPTSVSTVLVILINKVLKNVFISDVPCLLYAS